MNDLQPFEIDVGNGVYALTFTENGEHLISGGEDGVQVWQVKDGKHVATMPVEGSIVCVAASRDGRWIAGGTHKQGEMFVWDATTHEQVFTNKSTDIEDVDFSPDSTHLVSADGTANTATIWDVVARQKAHTLSHGARVSEAKYSPQGDRIATVVDSESVRVWDLNDNCTYIVGPRVSFTSDLLWCNDHLFVKSPGGIIKQIDANTGSTVSECLIPGGDDYSRIALLQRGKLVACSVQKTIVFLDTATHAQSSPIQLSHYVYSTACSPDGQLLAVAAETKIVIKVISAVAFRSLLEPELDIDSATLDAWKDSQLTNAEALLSSAIPTSENQYHALAARALVWTRLGQYDAALVDAEESVKIRRSVIGYIAKCVALVRMGETDSGSRVCDTAFLHFPLDHASILPLIKVVALFMSGKHEDAISCIDVLVTDPWVDPALYVVQAYMHFLCGNLHMESSNYERAIQSFVTGARIKLLNPIRQPPPIVSLISGWKFDSLVTAIQERLCDALSAAGRPKEDCKSVLRVANEETT